MNNTSLYEWLNNEGKNTIKERKEFAEECLEIIEEDELKVSAESIVLSEYLSKSLEEDLGFPVNVKEIIKKSINNK